MAFGEADPALPFRCELDVTNGEPRQSNQEPRTSVAVELVVAAWIENDAGQFELAEPGSPGRCWQTRASTSAKRCREAFGGRAAAPAVQSVWIQQLHRHVVERSVSLVFQGVNKSSTGHAHRPCRQIELLRRLSGSLDADAALVEHDEEIIVVVTVPERASVWRYENIEDPYLAAGENQVVVRFRGDGNRRRRRLRCGDRCQSE